MASARPRAYASASIRATSAESFSASVSAAFGMNQVSMGLRRKKIYGPESLPSEVPTSEAGTI